MSGTRASIDTVMVLAAGFGKRLRPITNTMPKPLVPVGGRAMLDRALDTAAQSGISRAVVNIHYLGAQIIEHCAQREAPQCVISDERDAVLETGGGVVKALPLLGPRPFALLNADTFWVDHGAPSLARMMARFDVSKMDILLLVCAPEKATGHSGVIDFQLDADGTLARADRADQFGFIYAGAAIMAPTLFKGASAEPHSLNVYFDRAIEQGRLHGMALEDGHWFTVGTPQGLEAVNQKLAEVERS